MDMLTTIANLAPVLAQFGFAAAAWRMASALKGRVDDHEVRIKVLEKTEA